MKRTLAFGFVLGPIVAAQAVMAAPAATFPARPRIATYSPTLAALAWEVGLGPRVVAVTRWTRLPPGETRPIVGDAVAVDIEAMLAARPDVVVLQGRPVRGFDTLKRLAPALRVESVSIERLQDIPAAARRLLELAGCKPPDHPAIREFEEAVRAASNSAVPEPRPRVLFVDGVDRPLVAGAATYIGDMIELCGGRHAGADIPGRAAWKPADIETIMAAQPDILICHVGAPAAEAPALVWWNERLPASRGRRPRVHAVSDPEWLLPSLRIARLLPSLRRMIAPLEHPRGAGRAPD